MCGIYGAEHELIIIVCCLDRCQLPPEDYNAPDLTYATKPCGVDVNGIQQVLLFRFNVEQGLSC
jgi:hypothetical protein